MTLDSEPGWWGLAVPQRLGSACRAPLGGNALPCVWLGPALQWSTCAVAEFVCMLCAELKKTKEVELEQSIPSVFVTVRLFPIHFPFGFLRCPIISGIFQ